MNIKEIVKDPAKVEKICRQYFNSIDKNKNGVLEYKEIKIILVKFAEESDIVQPPEEEILDAFNKLDTNHDGKISYSEFKTLFYVYKLIEKNKNNFIALRILFSF